MRTLIGVIIGALIMFFGFKQCETPQEVRTITKIKNVPTYIEKVTTVKVPVTKIKYIRLHDTTTTFVHDTLNNLVEVTTYDTVGSLAIIPYQDSLVTINDSITLSGTILDFKRHVTVKERQPDTLTITKEITKYFRGVKYYVGIDSDFDNLFQRANSGTNGSDKLLQSFAPSFGLSYDTKKFQVSLGFRPTTKIVETRFFLPLIKF